MSKMTMKPNETELLMLQLTGHASYPFADARVGSALHRYGQAWQGVMDNLLGFRNRVTEINVDRYLSADGRKAKVGQAADQYRQNIHRIDTTYLVDIATKLIPEMREQMRIRPIEGDPVVKAVRASEIRAWFRSMDNLAVGQAIIDDASNGGQELLEAYIGAPRGSVPPIDPVVIKQAQDTIAQRQNPAVAKELAELVEAVEGYEKLRDFAIEEINEAAGVIPEPRII
jgi:hypothetical protein